VPYRFPAGAAELACDFRAMHEQLYGFSTDEDWELEALRLSAFVATPPIEIATPRGAAGAAAPSSTMPCWFAPGAPIATPRYRRGEIASGTRIVGPAIVEDDWSTITVPPGVALAAAAGGHLVLTLEAAP
jgi:N-methylhydantoinase A